ncbi:putative phosphatidylinositol-3,4,5-trisphosphate 3-phosphatase [Kluyveromyces lactis]|uniref:phosphatidylinositol-3,4,5-trisphosphate 3-phosphatase n=1 Tax=Kluyveromyces lactis (strain ATCC 8585 / CBS 2359 / DSM 70799 / NBRC 1267 / NRRL Y-1140 / WM37) TaxID=284590 RepID=Q6CIS7_KLULA|nr:uncharacterized protein KLLA0_F24288g [Kluyveromyces lactis]CAG98870.1 KLLA0F24288p [Kluyveromyces lactis]|eukprot:XP_456162.1 uncharacterized protein KLLA0_F24288g [Kluyveromyces lactis]
MTLSKFNPEHIIKSIYSSPFNQYKNNMGLVLDVSYVTDNIIVCSYPVMKYPKMFYRNSLVDLVTYLDANHGRKNWKIYNLKAEMNDSDYTDDDFAMVLESKHVTPPAGKSEKITSTFRSRKMLEDHCNVSGIKLLFRSNADEIVKPPISVKSHLLRAGWIDHSPPSFLHLQNLIDDIRDTVSRGKVAVIHCKMGKGRSGTLVVAYLMTYLQLPRHEAQSLFLSTRFKTGISKGVTIASQLRYLKYQEMFLRYEAKQREEIIKNLSTIEFKILSIEFTNSIGQYSSEFLKKANNTTVSIKIQSHSSGKSGLIDLFSKQCSTGKGSLRSLTSKQIIVPNINVTFSDIRLSFGIRSKTSQFINNVSHLSSFSSCWLNLYWESVLQSKNLDNDSNYILPKNERFEFYIPWEELDGFKGTSGKGLKLFDSISIRWMLL